MTTVFKTHSRGGEGRERKTKRPVSQDVTRAFSSPDDVEDIIRLDSRWGVRGEAAKKKKK